MDSIFIIHIVFNFLTFFLLFAMVFDPYTYIPVTVIYLVVKNCPPISTYRPKFKKWLSERTDTRIYYGEGSGTYGEEVEERDHVMMCYHPHGVLTNGIMFNLLLNPKFSNFKILGANACKFAPFLGELATACGLEPVSKRSMLKNMRQGNNLIIVPGGFPEIYLSFPNSESIYIKERKGFIKYALRYGYTLYPVYTFGENDLYDQFKLPFLKQRMMLSEKIGLPFVVPKRLIPKRNKKFKNSNR